MSVFDFFIYLQQKARDTKTAINLRFSSDDYTVVTITVYGEIGVKAKYIVTDYDMAANEDYYKSIVDELIKLSKKTEEL